MGIIEEELGSTELADGTPVDIEYNEGDVIHVHIGRFRMNLSEREFQELRMAVENAREDLQSVKDGL